MSKKSTKKIVKESFERLPSKFNAMGNLNNSVQLLASNYATGQDYDPAIMKTIEGFIKEIKKAAKKFKDAEELIGTIYESKGNSKNLDRLLELNEAPLDKGANKPWTLYVDDKKVKTFKTKRPCVIAYNKLINSDADFEEIKMIAESKIDEASLRKVFNATKKGNFPVTLVAIENGKVVDQKLVGTREIVPAAFNEMQREFPKARVHVEDNTGKRLFSEDKNTWIPNDNAGDPFYGGGLAGTPSKDSNIKKQTGGFKLDSTDAKILKKYGFKHVYWDWAMGKDTKKLKGVMVRTNKDANASDNIEVNLTDKGIVIGAPSIHTPFEKQRDALEAANMVQCLVDLMNNKNRKMTIGTSKKGTEYIQSKM